MNSAQLAFNYFKKKIIGSRSFKIGANIQAILLRGKEKGAEFYLAFFNDFKVNYLLTFVELNYTKVAISRYICRFINLE